jgi:hypothetical protein
MPMQTVPNTELKYHLICFDAELRERTDDPDGKMSQRVLDVLRSEPVTDVFLMTHGWMGDVPAAQTQCNNWIGGMAANTADLRRVHQARPGFTPLMIGLHWPSLPFGDEDLGGGGDGVSFAAPGANDGGFTPDKLCDEYATRLAATPAARQALQTIIVAALDNVAPDKMPEEVAQAYAVLDREAGLGSEGAAGDPGSDRDPFDAEATFEAAEEEMVSFGGFSLGGLLAPLRTLSFWKMKDRGRQFGETGVLPLLNSLQQAVPEGRDVRFHLMGHSFGCVVMSAALAGPGGLSRPVHSAALLQGALSLWSFAAEIPHAAGRPGYFYSAIADHQVAGPLITSQSEHDTAVGRWYPLAAGVRGQVHFAPGELPKYGALGTYGIRGAGTDAVDMELLPADGSYNFEPGKIYNLQSSEFIKDGSGPEGAHNDISGPEVTHAFWEAVLTE